MTKKKITKKVEEKSVEDIVNELEAALNALATKDRLKAQRCRASISKLGDIKRLICL